MGTGDWGLGTGDWLTRRYRNCFAQCPMPHTQFRPIYTRINDLSHKESNHGIHPRVAPTTD
ncbi:MAG: hypothetical protein V7K67_27180 [Nostoc sp.]